MISKAYLSELKDVYGDSIDSILQGNTGNILYIKSTDNSMLETLENLSGKMHRVENDSQTISKDKYKIFNRTDGKVSTNRTSKEVPVISKNDMLRIPKANLMVFGKGNPIWSRNQLIMPYSYMLLWKNPLQNFEDPQDYTLKTVPTTANTMDFDILNNQPNFIWMVNKRREQALLVDQKMKLYRKYHTVNGHALTDDDVSKINPEALSEEIMRAVNEQRNFNNEVGAAEAASGDGGEFDSNDVLTPSELAEQQMSANAEENTEMLNAEAEQDAKANAIDTKLYGGHQLSRHDLLHDVSDDVNDTLAAAYAHLLNDFRKSPDYEVAADGSLNFGGDIAIKVVDPDEIREEYGDDAGDGLDDLMTDSGSSDDPLDDGSAFEVEDTWRSYLASLPDWSSILDGKYDEEVASIWHSLSNS